MPRQLQRGRRVQVWQARRFGAIWCSVLIAACTSSDNGASSVNQAGALQQILYDAETVAGREAAEPVKLETVRTFGESGRGALYRPDHIAVDSSGRVAVADNGNKFVVIFGADGQPLHLLGRQGQGPQEFQIAQGVAAAAGRIYLLADGVRLVAWSSEGEFLSDTRLSRGRRFGDLAAFDDGTLVASSSVPPSNPSEIRGHYMDQLIAAYDGQGEELRRLAVLPQLFRTSSTPLPEMPTARSTVSATGRVYATGGKEYAISAIDGRTGERVWDLQVQVEPEAVTDEDIERTLAGMRGPGPFTRDQFEWAQYFPALRALAVDGHGHLYVYPWIRRDPEATHVPVDVYDENGAHVYSGMIERKAWGVGRDDLVYGSATSEQSGEVVVVAYRIVEPFGR